MSSRELLQVIAANAGFTEGMDFDFLAQNADLHHQILAALDKANDPNISRQTFNEFFFRLGSFAADAEERALQSSGTVSNLLKAGAVRGFNTLNAFVNEHIPLMQIDPLHKEEPFVYYCFGACNFLAKPRTAESYIKYLYLYENSLAAEQVPSPM